MSVSYPTLNFGLGEELDMLRDSVRSFCDAELAPRAAEIDQNNEFPMDMWRKFGDLGLLEMTVSEELGFLTAPTPTYVLTKSTRTVTKRRSRSICQSFALESISALWRCQNPMPDQTWSV